MPSTGSSKYRERGRPGRETGTDDRRAAAPAPAAGAHHLCPSFSPRAPGKGVVFGIVAGTSEQPEVVLLETPEPVTEEVFELAAPYHPSEIFRIAAPCVEGGCKNFENGFCHLAQAAIRGPASAEDLPPCRIRSHCVWWHQEGRDACLRCPQIVTNNLVSLAIRNEMKR